MKAWKNESDEERRARVSWRRSSYSRCSVLVEHLLVWSVSNRPSLSVTHRLTKQAGADLNTLISCSLTLSSSIPKN